MTIVIFNYEGKRQEWSEQDTLRIFSKTAFFKTTLDKLGMVGIAPGTIQEMIFLRKDERYLVNLRKYLAFIKAQPPRTLSNESLEDLSSRKPYIHPAETSKFKK